MMPSDWAIQKVIELRARQRDQNLSVGLADPTGNRFDALIGEAFDEIRANGHWHISQEGSWAEAVSRLQAEIAERQSRLYALVLGDQRRGVNVPIK